MCIFNISISFMKGVGGRNVFLYFVFNLVCNYLIYWKVQKVLNTVSYIWNLRNKSHVLTFLKELNLVLSFIPKASLSVSFA